MRTALAAGIHHPLNEFARVGTHDCRIPEGIRLAQVADGGRIVARQDIIECGTKGIEISPGTYALNVLIDLLRGSIARRVAHRNGRGSIAAGCQLLAGTKVNKDGVALLVEHDVARFQVKVPDLLLVHLLKTLKHLAENAQALTLGQRLASTLQQGRERLTLDIVHHIVGRAVLLKQIVHLNQMLVMQTPEPASLLLELLALLLELLCIGGIAHADVCRVALVALIDTLHEELLHGKDLIELDIAHHIGIAESARRQIAFNTILSHLQLSTYRQHCMVFLVVVLHNSCF